MDSIVPPEHVVITRLNKRVQRETRARLLAEEIAECALRDLYQRQQQIMLLEAIAVAANEAIHINDAIALALDEICRYTTWPVGHALLVSSHDQGQLRSARLWHLSDPEQCAAFRQMSETMQFPIGLGLPGRVAQTGEPVWIMDITTDSNFPRAPVALQAGLKASFGFPVSIDDEVVAVLEFFSSQIFSPDENLLRLMRQIGRQLGRVLERQRAQEKLRHNALHDSLTQLANRALFMDRLNNAMHRARRYENLCFAVLFIDLDRFKTVNDSLGHVAGDALIIAVAKRLSESLRTTDLISHERDGTPLVLRDCEDDLIARMGGDEFTILLDHIRDTSDAIRVAERIQGELSRPFIVGEQEIYTTASIGITTSASDYQNVNDILRDADAAMYRAKAEGRARWELFDIQMRDRAVTALQLEADMHHALERSQFSLRYQPIVKTMDGVIQGFEALLRWQHPVRGWISPVEFIPLAEETGLITSIGAWVLTEACQQCAQWQKQFPRQPALTISVNLSALQLAQPNLVAYVASVLQQSGLAPGSLKLEITESTVMRDPVRANTLLLELKQMGIKISLDDFGTGYSSLSQLRRLPLDTLKVDRSFVSDMDSDDEKRKITKLIVELAQLLGMNVIAEGAETALEVAQLRIMGCEYVQGYYFYRPLDVNAVEQELLAGRAENLPIQSTTNSATHTNQNYPRPADKHQTTIPRLDGKSPGDV